MKTRNVVTSKDKYRLWWAFLKILRTTTDFEVEWDKYERWGNVKDYNSFEKWWKVRGCYLQQAVVREVTQIPVPRPQNTVYLEVPLNRAPRRLANRARHIISARFDTLYPELKSSRRKTSSFVGDSGFTDKRDIRVARYRDLLTLHNAIWKKHPELTGIRLLKVCNAYDKANQVWNEEHPEKKPRLLLTSFTTHHFSASHLDVDERLRKITEKDYLNYRTNTHVSAVLRNLIRALQHRDQVLRYVAKGEFPGPAL